MNKVTEHSVTKAVDSLQQLLTSYACDLTYAGLSSEVIHATKVRIIDTLGVSVGGFFGEPCQIARNLAAQMPNADGASVIGTRMKTTPDMAAFVNAITARSADMTDTYQWPGSYHGHPSDVIMPILAAAEHAQASGRELITSTVLGYEVFLRMCDVIHNENFDNTNFACLGTAMSVGKLFKLSHDQLSHCISMAVVPNNILRQVRLGPMSMWKVVAAGQAGRAGVFATLLARVGMEGPHLPFEGKAGWCEHVAGQRFTLNTWGGKGAPFKILDTCIKNRPSTIIAPILAAEKLAPLKSVDDVKQITVEVYKQAKQVAGTGEHHWNPDSREAAVQSTPYNVAATLIDGTVTLHSFNDAHLWNPRLRALMQKIEVIENEEYTQARQRQEHRARITIVTRDGTRLVEETGGDQDDLSAPRSDAQIVEKFRGLSEDVLGTKRVNTILDRLWHLEDMQSVAEIPPELVIG